MKDGRLALVISLLTCMTAPRRAAKHALLASFIFPKGADRREHESSDGSAARVVLLAANGFPSETTGSPRQGKIAALWLVCFKKLMIFLDLLVNGAKKHNCHFYFHGRYAWPMSIALDDNCPYNIDR